MTQQAKPRSTNRIVRFGDAYEAWCKKHLPDWLYKIAIMHPERFGRKPDATPIGPWANVYTYFLIILAIILFVASTLN